MIEWKLEVRKLNELKKHSNNPRKISREQFNQIQNSLDKFGLIEKPVINLDNTIISGHQRVQILRKQKVSTLECWVPNRHLSDKEVDELLIKRELKNMESTSKKLDEATEAKRKS